MFSNMPSIQEMAMRTIAFLVALTVHEYAHAKAALVAGDDTAQRAGRVSLNPLDHLDPMGTLLFFVTMIAGFGIAWGKPVPVNHYNLKSPRWDSLKVSIWGPLSNIITAVILAIVLRLVIGPLHLYFWADLLSYTFFFNLVIAVFNMIPIPPLDGSHILAALLPYEVARKYGEIMSNPIIRTILIVVVIGGGFRMFIGPPVEFLTRFLLG